MIIKVYFTQPQNPITIKNQSQINSFIHKSLGHNNYHDNFSDYSISTLQGGKFIGNDLLSFKNSQPWIQITSSNSEFINEMILKISNSSYKIFDMEFDHFDFDDFDVNKYCDVIYTLSPISLKDKQTDKKITFKDEGWLEKLEYNCIQKLQHKNINDTTFKIELRHPEKFKVKKIDVGHNSWNLGSQVSLKIYGKEETRKELYNMGIGNCTGSGFGAIKLYH